MQLWRRSLRESIHQFPEPFLGVLKNRLAVANKKRVEVESQERSHARAQPRRVVHHLFRQEPAAAGRISDHGVADDEDLPLRPVKRDFPWGFAGHAYDDQRADLLP